VNRVVVLALKLEKSTLEKNSLLNSLPFQGKEAADATKKLFTQYNLK